jgi:anti-sigma regulatory factor (Ser/Thr protein kinase)
MVLPCSNGMGLGFHKLAVYSQDEWKVNEDFMLLIYTDGLVNLGNDDHVLYNGRWLDSFTRTYTAAGLGGRDRIEAMEQKIWGFARRMQQDDDISVLILDFKATIDVKSRQTDVRGDNVQKVRAQNSPAWEESRQLLFDRTEGKLTLITDSEVQQLIAEGDSLFTYRVKSPEDLATIRYELRVILNSFCLAQKRLFHYLVAVNEAVTNALIYGQDACIQMLVLQGGRMCRVVVVDSGEGIPLGELPQAVLLRGYSKRQSLGVGFPVMLHYADHIWLYTSKSGTVLMLDFTVDTISSL